MKERIKLDNIFSSSLVLNDLTLGGLASNWENKINIPQFLLKVLSIGLFFVLKFKHFSYRYKDFCRAGRSSPQE